MRNRHGRVDIGELGISALLLSVYAGARGGAQLAGAARWLLKPTD